MSAGSPSELERLSRLRPALETRAATVAALRRFLEERGSLEVETPKRVRCPGIDVHIEVVGSEGAFLITSPELQMKRLVAAGYRRVHQIGPTFRRGEVGHLHRPEFTLLEWYRAEAGSEELADEIEAMLPQVTRAVTGTTVLPGRDVDLEAPWERLTVRQAFERHAGWSPGPAPDEDRFMLDLVERVEPRLGRGRPTLLLDYPASMAALARLRPGDATVSERFEVYVDGIEIANAYGELNDPVEQRSRFLRDNERRVALGRSPYPVDEGFLDALGAMPRAAGAALGVDRLVMLLCGARSISEVMAFPDESIDPGP